MSGERFDVIVVGAGIAGASLAYFLAERGCADVLILEREIQPGRHATGRSAATLVELDPIVPVRELKVAGARFLREPPAGFAPRPLLERSGVLLLLRDGLWDLVRQAAPVVAAAGIGMVLLNLQEARELVPVLRGRFDGGAWLPEDGHIDVHELLHGYLRGARSRGAVERLGVEVEGVRVEGGRCVGVTTAGGDEIRCRWVVDAAGAWAGMLGTRAGALSIPLVPFRRTIVTFAAPGGIDAARWPFVVSDQDKVYFGPESGGLLASPMDEEPETPGDARPTPLAVAETMERLRSVAPDLVPQSVRRAWAGLRTFAPDRVPVVGEDPRLPGFFWLAGQGGSGIETSPALGRIAADLLLEGRTEVLDASVLAPERFA
jgi:D-arginine dehydrogenase